MFSIYPTLNKLGWARSGVKPQARLFIYIAPLVDVFSNLMQGANINLASRKNHSSDEDQGFGCGWGLTLTRKTGNCLCLYDGRKFLLNKDGGIDAHISRMILF